MNKIKIWCAPEYQGDPPSVKPGDAGIDLRFAGVSPLTLTNDMGQVIARTAVHVEIPEGMCGLLWARSGLGAKHGLHVHAGVIDETYRGEVMVIISVAANQIAIINPGDRFAQMVVVPYLNVIEQVNNESDLSTTERGEKGLGSSGQA